MTAAPAPIRGLLGFALQQRRALAVTVAATLCQHALGLAAAGTGAWLVGQAALGGDADLTAGLVLLGLFVVGAALSRWWQMWIAHDFAYRLLADLRVRVFDGIARTAPAMLIGRRSGDLAATAMQDVESVEWFYAHTLADYVAAGLVTVGVLVTLAVIAPPLAAALLPFVVLLGTVPYWLARRAARQGRALQAAVGALGAEVVDGVQGMRELVSFGREHSYAERLLTHTKALHQLQTRYGRRLGLERAAVDAVLAAGLVAMLIVSAVLVERGDLDLELLPAAVVLAASALAPIAEVSVTAGTLGQIRASSQRVLAVIDEPPHVGDTGTRAPGHIEPSVSFVGVRFRYAPHRPDALRDVTFDVAPGETVALVGQSGAGKSTCVNLLLRFWDVVDGSVRIGGHDVRDLPLSRLRDLVALVPQDVYLFNASVRDNIRLALPDAGDREVEQAARLALAHDFVSALPRGYDTVVSERGLDLSGGQRQRIAIARALLKDAPILVLDEAVSNLDARNERELRLAIDAARARRTTLLIAHRPSTIAASDRIVVLAHGTVAEAGTHHELLERSGAYARLIRRHAA